MNKKTKLVEITTQNHGFTVDEDLINTDKVEVTHINLNDNTIEGLRFKKFKGISVQYHPEASPGPHDSSYLFDQFMKLVKQSSDYEEPIEISTTDKAQN